MSSRFASISLDPLFLAFLFFRLSFCCPHFPPRRPLLTQDRQHFREEEVMFFFVSSRVHFSPPVLLWAQLHLSPLYFLTTPALGEDVSCPDVPLAQRFLPEIEPFLLFFFSGPLHGWRVFPENANLSTPSLLRYTSAFFLAEVRSSSCSFYARQCPRPSSRFYCCSSAPIVFCV